MARSEEIQSGVTGAGARTLRKLQEQMAEETKAKTPEALRAAAEAVSRNLDRHPEFREGLEAAGKAPESKAIEEARVKVLDEVEKAAKTTEAFLKAHPGAAAEIEQPSASLAGRVSPPSA